MRFLHITGIVLLLAGVVCFAFRIAAAGRRYTYEQNQVDLPRREMGLSNGRLRIAFSSAQKDKAMPDGVFMEGRPGGGTYAGGLLDHNRYLVRTKSGPILLDELWISFTGLGLIFSISGAVCLLFWYTKRIR